MKNKYDIFTKGQLVEFLNKYEGMFRMIDTPFDIMVGEKMNLIMDAIDKCNNRVQVLNENFKTSEDKIDCMIEITKNHEEWNKLNKEYEKLSVLRFGRNDKE